MLTTFMSSLLNTFILALIAIALVVVLRLMCNIKKNEIGEKITKFYRILFYCLGIITGALIIGYIVIYFMKVKPFPVWYQNLITLMCITVVALALVAKRKNNAPQA